MIGVTALSGMMPPPPGSTQNKLHAKATTAPIKTVEGNSMRWSDTGISRRAMCGTARPMNETGPQHAVTTAVNKPVMTKSQLRTRTTLTPRFLA